jgi:hypothetical protein
MTRCPQVYEELVALTGIEGAWRQFSSVQLSLSGSKYVQLVRRGQPQTCHKLPALSLGCHSSSCKSTGATLRSFSPPPKNLGGSENSEVFSGLPLGATAGVENELHRG